MSLKLSSASLCGDAHPSYEIHSQELLTALEEGTVNYHKASLAVTKLMALVVHELYQTRQHICLQFKNVALRSVIAGLRLLARNIHNLAQSASRRWSIPF